MVRHRGKSDVMLIWAAIGIAKRDQCRSKEHLRQRLAAEGLTVGQVERAMELLARYITAGLPKCESVRSSR
jgi:hypothetical protein